MNKLRRLMMNAGWLLLGCLFVLWLLGDPTVRTLSTIFLFALAVSTQLGWEATHDSWCEQKGKHLSLHGLLTNEVLELRAALLWCALHSWDGSDINGGDFQEEMEERGLMIEVPATQDVRDEFGSDTMLTFRWLAGPNYASDSPEAEG